MYSICSQECASSHIKNRVFHNATMVVIILLQTISLCLFLLFNFCKLHSPVFELISEQGLRLSLHLTRFCILPDKESVFIMVCIQHNTRGFSV